MRVSERFVIRLPGFRFGSKVFEVMNMVFVEHGFISAWFAIIRMSFEKVLIAAV